jgi:Fe-S-cluster containining protein
MRDLREQARLRLREVYARVAEDVAASPSLRCELSGRCCRFREAGHQLWLTRLEYEEMTARGGAPGGGRGGGAGACPWLEGGLCANRDGRALACRTYFCSDEPLAATLTERWHREIRRIHDECAVPYEYRSLEDHGNPGPRAPSKEGS